MDGKDADLWAEVALDLHRGYNVASLLKQKAYFEQQQAAAKLEHYHLEGINEADIFLDIPETAYFYWVNRLGPECWEDQSFRSRFARMHPECVRRNVLRSTTITKPQPVWDIHRAIGTATNPEAARILEHVAG